MIADSKAEATAELMLDTIGQLARRHVIVFVALDDPALEEPLSVAPTSGKELALELEAKGYAQYSDEAA